MMKARKLSTSACYPVSDAESGSDLYVLGASKFLVRCHCRFTLKSKLGCDTMSVCVIGIMLFLTVTVAVKNSFPVCCLLHVINKAVSGTNVSAAEPHL